jgi:transposase-like protein
MSKKRRTYSAEFKLSIVMEGLRGEKPTPCVVTGDAVDLGWE